MLVHQGFRFELDPPNATRSALSSHCGASRYAFNWGLRLVNDQLEATRKLTVLAIRQGADLEEAITWARKLTGPLPFSLPALRRAWNATKHEVAPWWAENSKEAYSSGLDGLARALENWSKGRRGERAGHSGFPTQKKKGHRRSCRFTTGSIGVVDDRHVKLPRIGRVRTKEQAKKLRELLDDGRARICSATISEEAGRWFVSFTCKVERHDVPGRLPEAVVGVDLGVKHLAVLSTGEVVENPKALGRYARRIAGLSRELARRELGSKRRRRTKAKLARCHAKVANTRRDAIHELTSDLASSYGTVVIEDLNVAGMTAAPRSKPDHAGGHGPNGRRRKAGLNRAILDASFGEVRRQLVYKLAWHGGTLVVADRFFASSKLCSSCGAVKAKLCLDERTYCCEHCGLVLDRDLNAALNLAAYGRRALSVAGSGPETRNARGGAHRRLRSDAPVKREDGTVEPDKTVTAPSQGEAA
jgi:putative transposase